MQKELLAKDPSEMTPAKPWDATPEVFVSGPHVTIVIDEEYCRRFLENRASSWEVKLEMSDGENVAVRVWGTDPDGAVAHARSYEGFVRVLAIRPAMEWQPY